MRALNRITLARVRAAQRQSGEAPVLLAQALEEVGAAGMAGLSLQILVLQALTLRSSNEPERAFSLLG